MMMYNPPHPGQTVLELCVKPLSISITEASKALDVSRRTLSDLINGNRGISVEMAERLSLAFGSEPIFWLNLQLQYDLWSQKNKKKKLYVRQLYKQAS